VKGLSGNVNIKIQEILFYLHNRLEGPKISMNIFRHMYATTANDLGE